MNDNQKNIVQEAVKLMRGSIENIEFQLTVLGNLVDELQTEHDGMKAPTDDRLIESTDEIMELAGNVEDAEEGVNRINSALKLLDQLVQS